MPACSYCGHDCAPNADACPKCGANLQKEREEQERKQNDTWAKGWAGKAVAAYLVFTLIYVFIGLIKGVSFILEQDDLQGQIFASPYLAGLAALLTIFLVTLVIKIFIGVFLMLKHG